METEGGIQTVPLSFPCPIFVTRNVKNSSHETTDGRLEMVVRVVVCSEGNGRREASHGPSPRCIFLWAWKKPASLPLATAFPPLSVTRAQSPPQRERALRHGCSSRGGRNRPAPLILISSVIVVGSPFFLFFLSSVRLSPSTKVHYRRLPNSKRCQQRTSTLELPPSIIPSFVPMFGWTSSHLNTFAPGAQPKGALHSVANPKRAAYKSSTNSQRGCGPGLSLGGRRPS